MEQNFYAWWKIELPNGKRNDARVIYHDNSENNTLNFVFLNSKFQIIYVYLFI